MQVQELAGCCSLRYLFQVEGHGHTEKQFRDFVSRYQYSRLIAVQHHRAIAVHGWMKRAGFTRTRAAGGGPIFIRGAKALPPLPKVRKSTKKK